MSAEKFDFKTEMTQMMDIIIHSLYSNEEIFIRELISNASDAIDKARFESITNTDILEGNSEWKIKLIPNMEEGTLTIRDNGIGMNRESIIENLGTIAKSGTKEFIEKLKNAEAKDQPELIGQFGLGFYSAFMSADKVRVYSRMAGDKKDGIVWESTGQGGYTLDSYKKEERGTDVVVYLNEEGKKYLDEWKLRQVVKTFSNFIEHPVVMDVEKTEKGENDEEIKKIEEETLNSRQAIWQRSKTEITEDEYNEFYRHISRAWDEPAKVIHYSAEGIMEFKALLFLPKQRPFDFLYPERKNGLSLYIKRVFIMDDCKDLLPPYLRFVQGVVDASDLPLNVSREMLQNNAMVEKIRKNLVDKILAAMKEMKEEDFETYKEFFKQFSMVIKEGVYTDYLNKDKIIDVLLYESMNKAEGEYITLADYVENMPEGQDEIYFLLGENRTALENSPYLEAIKDKGYDVLFMTEPIDEWVMTHLMEYKEKKLKAIDKGELDSKDEEEKDEKKKEQDEKYKNLFSLINGYLDEVKEVRLSSRLKKSAACLVTAEGHMGAYMENVMKKIGHGDEIGENPRILELNGEHPAVQALQRLYEKDMKDPRIESYGRFFYDQAVLAEGSKIKDPQSFAQRINDMIVRDADL